MLANAHLVGTRRCFSSQNVMRLATRQPDRCVLCASSIFHGSQKSAATSEKRWFHRTSVTLSRLQTVLPVETQQEADSNNSEFSLAESSPLPGSKVSKPKLDPPSPVLVRRVTHVRKGDERDEFDSISRRRALKLSGHFSERSIIAQPDTRYLLLARLIRENTLKLADNIENEQTFKSWGINDLPTFKKWKRLFTKEIQQACKDIRAQNSNTAKLNPVFDQLRKAFVATGTGGLSNELKYLFQKMILENDISTADVERLKRIANLSHPTEWYPKTRQLQRKIHLHVGPTNSGKTYHALKKLEGAETGIYAGPLRLLAHEVYTRMNAKGKLCALITGEERRIPEGQTSIMSSCTVEMVPMNARVDVAVIDEIQMISDLDRGWAWTQAFLGLQANEVHLCGESRTVQLIKDLCKLTGDSLEIHNYERLSPLKGMKQSLKRDFSKLERGDCIIAFSRKGIHGMKNLVESKTGRRCAVVYGSLPPETRAQQSALFNDPDNDYDFLVASDAVGMGLNLSIKRIIFEATAKFDGSEFRTLSISQLKQIAGRAGRFRTASQDIETHPDQEANTYLESTKKVPQNTVGFVTTLEDYDLPIMTRAMVTDVEPLAAAGIMPPDDCIARFAAYFPTNTPLSYILLRMAELSSTDSHFFHCRYRDKLEIADCIQPYNLTISERMIFIASPASLRDPGMTAVTKAFAMCVSEQSGGELLDIPTLNLQLLDTATSGNKEDLRHLEALHKALTLYLWLSYRFAGVFRSQALAFHVKALCEDKIDACLQHVHYSQTESMRKRRRRLAALEIAQNDETPIKKSLSNVDVSQQNQFALPVDWAAESKTAPLQVSEDSEELFTQDRSVRA